MPIFLPCNEKVPAKAYERYPLRWQTWHAAFVTFTFVFDPTSFKCAHLNFIDCFRQETQKLFKFLFER